MNDQSSQTRPARQNPLLRKKAGARGRQVVAPSVTVAHQAIAQGEQSLGAISDIVKVSSGGGYFGRDNGFDGNLHLSIPAPVGFWDMKIFGLSYKGAVGLALLTGTALGVPFGVLIYDSPFHHALKLLVPFL